MNERLRELRKELGLSMEEFGKILGITKSGVSDIENGRRSVTDQHIKMLTIQPLKGKYLNETWFRNGEGEMFREQSTEDILTAFVKDLSFEGDESFKKRFVQAIAQMSDEGWKSFEKWLNEFLLNYQKPAAGDLDPDQEAEAYRQELIIQKRAEERSKASDGTEEKDA